jgi:hypothetical protein
VKKVVAVCLPNDSVEHRLTSNPQGASDKRGLGFLLRIIKKQLT